MWWRSKPYDRSARLTSADEAREKGQWRKAVRNYLEVLAHEPDDAATHARVAPLLAKLGRDGEARASFDRAGDTFMARGFAVKAVAVWSLAAQSFPADVFYWRRIAEEQVLRGHTADAVATLRTGRASLKGRRLRPLAIQLLHRVLELQPAHVEVTLDLANLLRIEGLADEALRLVRGLARLVRGSTLRRVRLSEFRLAPSYRVAVAWLFAR